MIVQQLYGIQNRHGYLPREVLLALADRLAVPLYRIQQVASFFPHYRLSPPDAELEVQICETLACQLNGAAKLIAAFRTKYPQDGAVKVCGVPCLGRCDRAPAARIIDNRRPEATCHDSHTDHQHQLYNLHARPGEDLSAQARRIIKAVESLQANSAPESTANDSVPNDTDVAWQSGTPVANWKINEVYKNATDISQRYVSIRDFIAVCQEEAKAMEDIGAATGTAGAKGAKSESPPPGATPVVKPDEDMRTRRDHADLIIKALETATLHGMGGPGARAFKKWNDVRVETEEEKFVVCNADESEPGTFKDRELLLRTPHLVLEGVILAGLVVKAQRGYIYIRHEFEEQIAAMQREIAAARAAGLCGDSILGSDVSLDIEVFVSPGGYICGEQTALIQAIQDERAEPRNRPPELQTNGLWDKPTLLSNVETFAWAPCVVLREHGSWYAGSGIHGSKGTRFFSVSGDVQQPGVYEVPIGITLGELIQRCGGMKQGVTLKAVALSGPSGGFLPAKLPESILRSKVASEAGFKLATDLRLDVNIFRGLGNLALGAGITIYGEQANLMDQALSSVRFYQRESCGKCVPCRIGSTKIVEITEDLAHHQLTHADIEQLKDKNGLVHELTRAMRNTAICGLGQVAASPLITLLQHFEDDVQACAKP